MSDLLVQQTVHSQETSITDYKLACKPIEPDEGEASRHPSAPTHLGGNNSDKAFQTAKLLFHPKQFVHSHKVVTRH